MCRVLMTVAPMPCVNKEEVTKLRKLHVLALVVITVCITAVLFRTLHNCPDAQPNQSRYIGRQIEGYVEPFIDPEFVFPQKHRLYAYKDTYQSNIVVVMEDIARTDINEHEWFYVYDIYPAGWQEIYQFLCYAILTYYDGDVPYDYYISLENGRHNNHPKTMTIFEVQTYGERPLNIYLDTFNYKIRVEEGLKKECDIWQDFS